eukprot:NODE_7532_length_767_cov_81.152174_g6920_i0.p1 GENE.NODE_7532_length_767_cov_81.152174_g6920_i0~~NODE_7532_length_767_cov_81.152174_g6920_i0.p1  ORF type:complete len:121 (-),score=12.77 NODE_7532_length_767_cov_81.152174_g6920_i0:336-698(-)
MAYLYLLALLFVVPSWASLVTLPNADVDFTVQGGERTIVGKIGQTLYVSLQSEAEVMWAVKSNTNPTVLVPIGQSQSKNVFRYGFRCNREGKSEFTFVSIKPWNMQYKGPVAVLKVEVKA